MTFSIWKWMRGFRENKYHWLARYNKGRNKMVVLQRGVVLKAMHSLDFRQELMHVRGARVFCLLCCGTCVMWEDRLTRARFAVKRLARLQTTIRQCGVRDTPDEASAGGFRADTEISPIRGAVCHTPKSAFTSTRLLVYFAMLALSTLTPLLNIPCNWKWSCLLALYIGTVWRTANETFRSDM